MTKRELISFLKEHKFGYLSKERILRIYNDAKLINQGVKNIGYSGDDFIYDKVTVIFKDGSSKKY